MIDNYVELLLTELPLLENAFHNFFHLTLSIPCYIHFVKGAKGLNHFASKKLEIACVEKIEPYLKC